MPGPPYHRGIDNRERSLFQGGRCSPSLSPYCSSTFSVPFYLQRPPSPFLRAPLLSLSLSLSLSPSGLSLLQIGLVVLRVHQDNSPAWLCVSSKRTLLSSSFSLSLPLPFLFFFLLQGMRERKRWRETRNKGNILYERRCACFMFCPFRDPSQCTHSFKEFLRVPAPPRSESSSPRAFCASFLPAVLGFQERRSARAQLLPRSLAIGDAPVAHGPESRFQPARVTFSKKEKRENQVNDLDQLLFVLIFATVNDWES